MFNEHKGAKGRPTRAFAMTVNHLGLFLACTKSVPGTFSDKTTVKFDRFVMDMKEGRLYSDVPFTLTRADGSTVEERGLYLISDNGYHT